MNCKRLDRAVRFSKPKIEQLEGLAAKTLLTTSTSDIYRYRAKFFSAFFPPENTHPSSAGSSALASAEYGVADAGYG